MLSWLLGCADPMRALASAEAPWWGDAAALQAGLELDLVEVPTAEPVGYWPRVTVWPTRIAVDNRAWVLDRGQAALPWLVDDGRAATLSDGWFPDGDPVALEAPLERLQRSLREGGDTWPEVPLLLVVDRAVPLETVTKTLEALGQAQFSTWAVAAVSGGRVRNVRLQPAGRCRALVRASLDDQGWTARLDRGRESVSPIACPGDPDAVAVLARTLQDACATEWAALEPDERCIELELGLGAANAGVFVETLGAAVHAEVDVGVLWRGALPCAPVVAAAAWSAEQRRAFCLDPSTARR